MKDRTRNYAGFLRQVVIAGVILTVTPLLLLALMLGARYHEAGRELAARDLHDIAAALSQSLAEHSAGDRTGPSSIPSGFGSGPAGSQHPAPPRSGADLRVFLLSREGEILRTVVPPADFRAEENVADPFRLDPAVAKVLAASPRGRLFPADAGGLLDFTGEGWAAVTTDIEDGRVLAVLRDRAVLFEGVYEARNQTVGIVAILACFCLINAFIHASNMVQRIMVSDSERDRMDEHILETGKLAAIGELAAGVAHEINNPVAIMIEEAGWVSDLMEDLPETEGGRLLTEETRSDVLNTAQRIATQGARCREITHSLLRFARRRSSAVMPIQINALVEEVASFNERRAKAAGITVHMSLSENLPLVTASPTQVQQLLFNLMNNALDAMQAQGGILTMATYRSGESVLLEVSDTGDGIPPELLPRVFEPFFTTKPVGKGTGLGLAISYGIARRSGGDISVRSRVGRGTSFTVRLPIDPGESDAAPFTGENDPAATSARSGFGTVATPQKGESHE